jgi:hypothetical protein
MPSFWTADNKARTILAVDNSPSTGSLLNVVFVPGTPYITTDPQEMNLLRNDFKSVVYEGASQPTP